MNKRQSFSSDSDSKNHPPSDIFVQDSKISRFKPKKSLQQLSASQAAKQILDLINKIKEDWKNNKYYDSESLFLQNLSELDWLLKSRLDGISKRERVLHPKRIVYNLLILMSDFSSADPSGNDGNRLRYYFGAALHSALDLLIIESYQEEWVGLEKIITTPEGGKIDILSSLENFRGGGQIFLDTQYELDCCKINLEMSIKSNSVWKKLFDVLDLALFPSAGMAINAGGILKYLNEIRKEMPKPSTTKMYAEILFFRRMTALSQKYPEKLKELQMFIAAKYQAVDFHYHYTFQESLANVIRFSGESDQASIQKKALGTRSKPQQEIKISHQEPSLWYFAQNPIVPVSRIFKEASHDPCRYGLIKILGDLLNNNIGHPLFSEIMDIIIYLNEREPGELTESRKWIDELIKEIQKNESKFSYYADFQKKRAEIVPKILQDDKVRMIEEQKLLLITKDENSDQISELRGKLKDLEYEYKKLNDEQKSLEENKNELKKKNEEYAINNKTLTSELDTIKQQLGIKEKRLERCNKDIEQFKENEKRIREGLSELEKESDDQQEKIAQLDAQLISKTDQIRQYNEKQLKLTSEIEGLSKKLNDLQKNLEKSNQKLKEHQEKFGDSYQEKLLRIDADLSKKRQKLDEQEKEFRKREEVIEHEKELLDERQINFIHLESILEEQIEEWDRFTKKRESLGASIDPARTNIVTPWPMPPKDEEFYKLAKEITLDDKYMCKEYARPLYDLVKIKHGTALCDASDEAARRWLLELNKDSCPTCGVKPVDAVLIDYQARSEIEKMTRDAVYELKQINSPLPLDSHPSEVELQDRLILECERGDLKSVQEMIKKGAKVFSPNSRGKLAMGAAIWGMNPDVVDFLLKITKQTHEQYISWETWEAHNQKLYHGVFAYDSVPKTFQEWHKLLEKIYPLKFIREFHVRVYSENWEDWDTDSLPNIKAYVQDNINKGKTRLGRNWIKIFKAMEEVSDCGIILISVPPIPENIEKMNIGFDSVYVRYENELHYVSGSNGKSTFLKVDISDEILKKFDLEMKVSDLKNHGPKSLSSTELQKITLITNHVREFSGFRDKIKQSIELSFKLQNLQSEPKRLEEDKPVSQATSEYTPSTAIPSDNVSLSASSCSFFTLSLPMLSSGQTDSKKISSSSLSVSNFVNSSIFGVDKESKNQTRKIELLKQAKSLLDEVCPDIDSRSALKRLEFLQDISNFEKQEALNSEQQEKLEVLVSRLKSLQPTSSLALESGR